MEEDRKEARRSIWRQRGRRFATGLNVAVSLLLALVVLSMVNYLSYRHYHRWDIGQRAYYRLSGKTKNLLSSLDTNVNVVAFFQKDHKLCEDVRNLLKEYEYETARTPRRMLKIEFVDPDRDLARTRQLKQKYDVLKEPNVVVFEASGRKKYVEARDLDSIGRYRLRDAQPAAFAISVFDLCGPLHRIALLELLEHIV